MVKLAETFKQFVRHIPLDGDITLVVLKGHLIVEEGLWRIVERRTNRPNFLVDAKLGHSRLMALARATVDQKSEEVNNASWVWPAIDKLNSLRNGIVHKLEPKDIEGRIEEIARLAPDQSGPVTPSEKLVLALWFINISLHSLVEPSTGTNAQDSGN